SGVARAFSPRGGGPAAYRTRASARDGRETSPRAARPCDNAGEMAPAARPPCQARATAQPGDKMRDDHEFGDVGVKLELHQSHPATMPRAPCQHQKMVQLLDQHREGADVLVIQ